MGARACNTNNWNVDGQSPGRREEPQTHVAEPAKLSSFNNAEACWFVASAFMSILISSLVSTTSHALSKRWTAEGINNIALIAPQTLEAKPSFQKLKALTVSRSQNLFADWCPIPPLHLIVREIRIVLEQIHISPGFDDKLQLIW